MMTREASWSPGRGEVRHKEGRRHRKNEEGKLRPRGQEEANLTPGRKRMREAGRTKRLNDLCPKILLR